MDHHKGYGARGWMFIAMAAALGIPGLAMRMVELNTGHLPLESIPWLSALTFGVGIVGAAFILSWAAEAAQKDVSAALAIAALAIIALLPEYAVEFVLAWDAGSACRALEICRTGIDRESVEEIHRVAANVTGANRLLIGLGWALVALIFWWRLRTGLILGRALSLELAMLTLATIVSFFLFFFHQVALPVAFVLLGIYFFYLWVSSRAKVVEPDLEGPAETVGDLPKGRRRLAVLLMFAYSAGVIISAVEPFVHGLVETGTQFGIDEFHLIQWLAPLASESPEIVVALLYTAKANPVAGIAVLTSAAVNQLTVLIGSMPLVFSLSLGQATGFPLDSQQSIEFFLTSTVALFGVVLLSRLRFGAPSALLLLALFILQLVLSTPEMRRIVALVYLGLAMGLLVIDPRRILLIAQFVRSEVATGLGIGSKASAAKE